MITGEPPHPDEEAINIHHIKKVVYSDDEVTSKLSDSKSDFISKRSCIFSSDSPNVNATSCKLNIHSVHHDKVQKEFSSATVIIYLNDVEIGGGTVWPCLSSFRNETQTSYYCEDVFKKGARWFDGDKTVVANKYQKHRVEEPLHSNLKELLLSAHVGCVDDVSTLEWVERPPVRTVARKGTAVLFRHNQQDLSPEYQMWHAGCFPRSGDKWTLQKFKELNKRYRKNQSKLREEL